MYSIQRCYVRVVSIARLSCRCQMFVAVSYPGGEHRGVSRKIQASSERDRLRRVLEEIAPAGFGLIARTAAEGRNRQQLVAEKDLLVRRWERIARDAESCQAPALVYKEGADFLSFLRDQLCLGLEQVVV